MVARNVKKIERSIKEKRPLKIQDMIPDFDTEIYRSNYIDLNKLTYLQLIDHYLKSGHKEKRIYNQ